MNEYKQEITLIKKIVFWTISILVLSSVIVFLGKTAVKATKIENAVEQYEEYQEIYNTCIKINTDICNMQKENENDKMFQDFSKSQRILALKTNLNRWINEYNAKSKMWGRTLWKSKNLPYELHETEFKCN